MCLVILYDGNISKGRPSEISPELRESLRDNPHVVRITNYTIRWSQKAYEMFSREYDKGTPTNEILLNLGIDPILLGERVAAFRAYYERHFKKTSDVIHKRTPREADKRSEKKLSKLEHEVAYLNQEVEFLKKF